MFHFCFFIKNLKDLRDFKDFRALRSGLKSLGLLFLSISWMVLAAEAGLVVGKHWALVADRVAVTPLTAGCIHRLFGAALGNELFLGCFLEFMYEIVRLLYKHKTQICKFNILVFCNAPVYELMKVNAMNRNNM